MSNSIDLNLEGTHSRESLSFHWVARFADFSAIYQFDKEIEHKFQEVINRLNELERFSLYNENTRQIFTVDLEKGLIISNNNLKIDEIVNEIEKKNIRLIFFRRHKIDLSEQLKELTHNIEYHLGFQYNDKLGNNKKTILIIDSEGNWVLGA